MARKMFGGLGAPEKHYTGVPPSGSTSLASATSSSSGPTVFSQQSAPAVFETLFNDFGVVATPFYNFWVDDELTNDKSSRGGRALSDVPRYIKLWWAVSPAAQLSAMAPISGALPGNQPSVRNRSSRSVKFNGGSDHPFSFPFKGIMFSPDHLQPSGFSTVAGRLANSYLAPGVIETVVETPLHNANADLYNAHVSPAAIQNLDEDTYLTHPEMQGVALSEIMSNVTQASNGVLRAAKVHSAARSVRPGTLFSGKFSIGGGLSNGSPMSISGIHASSPVLSFASSTAFKAEGLQPDQLADLASGISSQPASLPLVSSTFAKVKFMDPTIGGAIDQGRIDMLTRPEHAESAAMLAQFLPNLESFSASGIKNKKQAYEIPSFPSPPGLPSIEYVGYLVEKYEMAATGVFQKIDEMQVSSGEYDTYIDTKIVYGQTYRYRVRAVARWTRPRNVGVMGIDPLTDDQLGSQTKNIAPFVSSYFAGEWSGWSYASVIDTTLPAPPDELVVIPQSSKQRILVSVKLPYNPQRDINEMRILRKTVDASGAEIMGWKEVIESDANDPTVMFDPQNVLFIDTSAEWFQDSGLRYVYTAQSFTRHGEQSPYSDQVAARLNKEYATQGEFPTELISTKGVRKFNFGAFGTCPIRKTFSEIVAVPTESPHGATANISLSGRVGQGKSALTSKDYTVSVMSLDTGERTTFDVPLRYLSIPASDTEITEFQIVPRIVVPPKPHTFQRVADKQRSAAQTSMEKNIAGRQDSSWLGRKSLKRLHRSSVSRLR